MNMRITCIIWTVYVNTWTIDYYVWTGHGFSEVGLIEYKFEYGKNKMCLIQIITNDSYIKRTKSCVFHMLFNSLLFGGIGYKLTHTTCIMHMNIWFKHTEMWCTCTKIWKKQLRGVVIRPDVPWCGGLILLRSHSVIVIVNFRLVTSSVIFTVVSHFLLFCKFGRCMFQSSIQVTTVAILLMNSSSSKLCSWKALISTSYQVHFLDQFETPFVFLIQALVCLHAYKFECIWRK